MTALAPASLDVHRASQDSPSPQIKVNRESCTVCGRPLDVAYHPRGRRRVKCDPCRRFTGYLAAALRAAAEVPEFQHRARTRRLLLIAANQVKGAIAYHRDRNGRFTREAAR